MNGFAESLFKWIQTFKSAGCRIDSIEDLLDGIAIAQVLHTIAPEYFTEEWLSKLKKPVTSDNWRLRVSNLRKVLDGVINYYENVLLVSAGNSQPDVHLIGRDKNPAQLACLLQLVLVMAVNCEQKQAYIENITKLELHVQQNLMEAIQQLMMANQVDSRRHVTESFSQVNGNGNLSTDSLDQFQKDLRDQLIRTMDSLRQANEKKEAALKQNYDLSRRLLSEQNEKLALQQEHERLSEQLNQLLRSHEQKQEDEESDESERKVAKLKNKIEVLERELLSSEQQKEECLIKLELIERELLELRMYNEQLQRQVRETQELQDELDVHRHSADKVVKYEQTLETYRRRLEELADLKREWKTLEEKNLKLVTTNLELEEELRKSGLLKQQIADYRSKMQELQQELLERNHRCDRFEFELDRQKERLQITLQEKSILEREQLELRGRLKILEGSKSNRRTLDELDSLGPSKKFDSSNCLELEMANDASELREKMLRLEHENKLLKTRLEQTNQEAVLLLRNSYQDAKSRVKELEADNRKLNKKLVELECKMSENQTLTTVDDRGDRESQLEERIRIKSMSAATLNNKVHELEQRLTKLQGELSRKDDEFNEIDCRYRKYVHKAKQAVHMLEPLSNQLSSLAAAGQPMGGSCSVSAYPLTNGFSGKGIYPPILSGGPVSAPAGQLARSSPLLSQADALGCGSIEAMRNALAEKDRKIHELVVEMERSRNLAEMESRLITVAVHNIAFNLHRKAATNRTMVNAKSASINNEENQETSVTTSKVVGHASLLSKQRQATARRNNLQF